MGPKISFKKWSSGFSPQLTHWPLHKSCTFTTFNTISPPIEVRKKNNFLSVRLCNPWVWLTALFLFLAGRRFRPGWQFLHPVTHHTQTHPLKSLHLSCETLLFPFLILVTLKAAHDCCAPSWLSQGGRRKRELNLHFQIFFIFFISHG